MAIVKTDVPMTSERCTDTIDALLKAYPFLRSETITTTAFGRPVRTLTVGEGERKVLYSAAHHANEWITTPILLRCVEELAQAIQKGGRIFGVPASTIARYSTICTVPMVDPDGVDLVTGAIAPGTLEYETAIRLSENYPGIPFPKGWKANLLGVDLNLQYPAGWLRAREIKFSQGFVTPAPRDYVGRYPLDQQETTALAEYTRFLDPDLVLAYHTQGTKYSLNCQ